MIGNIIAYGFILLVALVLAVAVQEYYTLAALIILVIMPLVLVVINFIASRYVTIEMKKEAFRYVVGDKVEISVMMYNESIFPIQKIRMMFELEDGMGVIKKHQICTNISAREEKEVLMHFESDTAVGGYITFKKIYFYDVLGLVAFWKNPEGNGTKSFFGIFPKVQTCNVKFANRMDMGISENDKYSTNKTGSDKSEIFGIREYVPGDIMRDIHWNLSLKKDELIVKEFSKPLEEKITIILDTAIYQENKNRYKLLSKYYEYAHSLCETFLAAGVAYRIVVYNSKFKSFMEYRVDNSEQVYILTEILLRQRPEPTYRNPYGYRMKNLEEESLEGNVIYISCGIDGKFINYLKGIDTINKIYTVCIGKGEDFEGMAKEISVGAGCKYIGVGAEQELSEVEFIEL